MLQYLSLQSYRQYNELRKAVAAQVETGKIINHSNEKISVLDNKAGSLTSSISTDSLKSETGAKEEDIIVGWESSTDSLNPRQWTMIRRVVIFLVLWINIFAVDWASACDSQVDDTIEKVFHVGSTEESLSPSIYTFGMYHPDTLARQVVLIVLILMVDTALGLAIGSLFAGAISETVGRNPVYIISRIFHVLWLIGAALTPTYAGQIALRFLAGLSGSILLAIHAASTADLFGPVHRTIFWPIFALASFSGTVYSPVVGAWISQRGVWWRWTEWIPVILSGSTLILTLLFLPETFSPMLLSWRAKHLRETTGCQRFQSEMDLQKTFAQRLKTNLTRALHMITREPIVVLLGGWLVLEYIIVFSLLHGFSYMFEDTYDFSPGLSETVFVAVGVGAYVWVCIFVPIYYKLYKRKVSTLHEQITGEKRPDLITSANIPGTDLPQPEYRLWMALLSGPALPISMFWLGWTNYKSISPWCDICALFLLGFSWAGIYVTVYQYILDTYGIYAGSALSVVTCWRYLASGASNLYSDPMYDGIGVHWSATWLGILAIIQAPLPIIFYRYGHKIRMNSRFASQYARPDNPRDREGKALAWK